MRNQTHQPPVEQFAPVEDAALSLKLNASIIRQGIACGLVPIRRDNTGILRVHLNEVPDQLEEKIRSANINPELQAAVLEDRVLGLENSLAKSRAHCSQLESLVARQGQSLARFAAVAEPGRSETDARLRAEKTAEQLAAAREELSTRNAEVQRLATLLERTFNAIDAREQQLVQQSPPLSAAADRSMQLLGRALHSGELSVEQVRHLEQQLSALAHSHQRLEQELTERNGVIDKQQSLLDRMVSIAERSASNTTALKRRKPTFWQRLWGSGKGI